MSHCWLSYQDLGQNSQGVTTLGESTVAKRGLLSHQRNTLVSQQKWYVSAHASLCFIGTYVRQIGFFEPLERRFPSGAKSAQIHPGPEAGDALCWLIGRHQSSVVYGHDAPSGCGPHRRLRPTRFADQSVLADTLDAARDADWAWFHDSGDSS
jgi:hypothetical protein